MIFNIKKPSTARSRNRVGRNVFIESSKLQPASMLLTSTLKNERYRRVKAAMPRQRKPIAEILGKSFNSKAKVFANRETSNEIVLQQSAGPEVEAWDSLIASHKLGYFAMLRNLRDILINVPHRLADIIDMITDETVIQRSRALPISYLPSLVAFEVDPPHGVLRALCALSDAIDISLANVPRFDGRTLIALDGSGSMEGRAIQTGSLVAAALAKTNDADVMLFSNDAQYVALNRRDSTLAIADSLESQCAMAGTNFHSIFQQANRGYDRVIILSDMQGWVGGHAPTETFAQWKATHHCAPKVFSFDLNGCGILQFPERDIYCLAGWSDKSLEMLHFLDSDKQALIREIEAIELV